MAAILAKKTVLEGLVKHLTDKKKGFKLYLEADNSDGQSVVGGLKEDLERAKGYIEEHTELNARIIPLNAAGAFHSPIMGDGVKRVKQVVRRLRKGNHIRQLEVPVIANTTGRPIKYPWQIERELVDHITKPVKWRQTIEFLETDGIAATVEIGKKSVLSIMMKDKGKITTVAGIGAVALATFLYFRNRSSGK